VRVLAVAAVGGGFVELVVAISLSVRFMPRRESAHSTRALAAVHESASGTFLTCRRTLTMSVHWGQTGVRRETGKE
jgi:hypothetical protein